MARRRRADPGTGEELPRELNFEDDAPAGRIGDPVPARDVREEFPARRVREAGRGGVGGADVTADDLSPETLLDDDLSHTPSARHGRDALDTMLTQVGDDDEADGEHPAPRAF